MEIDRNKQMWEILNVFPIEIRTLTPDEKRKRAEQSLKRIRADIELSSSKIKEVFPSQE